MFISVWLMGGSEMADGKGTARARRSRPVRKVVAHRDRVNVALPLSMIRSSEPASPKLRDWSSLAGLVVSAIGFSMVIRELSRIAHASEAGRVSHRASVDEAASVR
jgi:hypothetical protein